MRERAYTLAEIDSMRDAIHKVMLTRWNHGDLQRAIEDRLRTYLMAGIDPSELYSQAEEAEKKLEAELKRRLSFPGELKP